MYVESHSSDFVKEQYKFSDARVLKLSIAA